MILIIRQIYLLFKACRAEKQTMSIIVTMPCVAGHQSGVVWTCNFVKAMQLLNHSSCKKRKEHFFLLLALENFINVVWKLFCCWNLFFCCCFFFYCCRCTMGNGHKATLLKPIIMFALMIIMVIAFLNKSLGLKLLHVF